MVKAKSIISEEVKLIHSLEKQVFQPPETDLEKFTVKINTPKKNHTIGPITRKYQQEIAYSFAA